MPKGQKGWCRGSKRCKDELLISQTILHECKYRMKKKKVSMAWVDFQKAFNSVPHSWIIISLKLTGINNKIIPFTKKAMSYWKPSMHQSYWKTSMRLSYCKTSMRLSYWKTSMRLHRREDNRNRRCTNTMWNISRRLIITTAILH